MLTQTKARSGALQGGRVVFLPLSSIRPNPAQPRTVFDAQACRSWPRPSGSTAFCSP